jgi:hypothetical protein
LGPARGGVSRMHPDAERLSALDAALHAEAGGMVEEGVRGVEAFREWWSAKYGEGRER